jgi:hypothetical protein
MAQPANVSTARRSTHGQKCAANTSDEIILTGDFSDNLKDWTDSEMAKSEVSESDEISAVEDSMSTNDDSSTTNNGVTQAQVYDNLKRIGELEDEKRRIQEEIWDRTEQLRSVVKHIDNSSILYKILESALADSPPKGGTSGGRKTASTKGAPKAAAKTPRRKTRRK